MLTIAAIACLFIVYRAMSLRRVLVDPLYRRRALWTAIAGSGLLGFLISVTIDALAASGYGILANNSTALLVEDFSWGLSFLALFGWIYTSVNVALSSDYFHRDVLGWSRGGKFVFVGAVVVSYLVASLPPPTNPALLADFNAFGNLVGPIFVIGLAYGGAVIVVTYRRIKDRAIKNYSKWVIASVASTFIFIALPVPLSFVFFAFTIFCMYCATGALVIRTHEIEGQKV